MYSLASTGLLSITENLIAPEGEKGGLEKGPSCVNSVKLNFLLILYSYINLSNLVYGWCIFCNISTPI